MSTAAYRADDFAPLDDEITARWMRFGRTGTVFFPNYLGLQVEDVRVDYCRMRLPFRSEILQGGGLVHGGAIASLLDAVLVPAVGGVLEKGAVYSTVDLHVQFIRGISASSPEDAIAEGWVVRRGRSTVFCESRALGADTDRLLAKSVSTYNVAAQRS